MKTGNSVNFRRKILRSCRKFGLAHVLIRGIEYVLLQTRSTAIIYWYIAPKFYQWWYSKSLRKYDKSLKAFDHRYIDPQRVNRLTPRGKPGDGTLKQVGSVISGQWDQQHCPQDNHSLFYDKYVEDTSLYQALKKRYKFGLEWEETEFYQIVIQVVKNSNNEWHGCTTIDEVNKKCEYVDCLYKSIRECGYKKQDEFRPKYPSFNEPFRFVNQYLMEITVDITRDGEILLVDGRHRLIIAKLLNLDRVPVTVIARHKNWMEKVSQASTKSESELLEEVT